MDDFIDRKEFLRAIQNFNFNICCARATGKYKTNIMQLKMFTDIQEQFLLIAEGIPKADMSRFVEFPLTAYVINEIKYKTDLNTFITFRKIDDITINGINDIAKTITFYGNIFFTKDEAKSALAVLNRGAAK